MYKVSKLFQQFADLSEYTFDWVFVLIFGPVAEQGLVHLVVDSADASFGHILDAVMRTPRMLADYTFAVVAFE